MENYVITIARGFGSGGKCIGEQLAQRLGIPCYESQILSMASLISGINEGMFFQQDEKLLKPKLLRMLASFPSDRKVTPQDKKFTSENNLYAIQSEVIKTLAKTQSCVIVGKCADYLLRDRNNVLSVYVDASRKACVESIMGKMSITEKEANRLIERTDKYRADYYNYYTHGGSWVNPTNYHLFLNSELFGRDACVDILEDIVKMRFFD